MQLVCLMPTIHFRPTESRKKSAKGGALPQTCLPHPLLQPSCTQAPALFPQGLRGLIPCLFPQVCTPVLATTIPSGQATQTEPPLSSGSTSGVAP